MPRFPHLAYGDLHFVTMDPIRGGMCIVREAYWHDSKTGLDHHVAVKSLRPEFLSNSDIGLRFAQESELLTETLRHPHIVKGFGVCDEGGQKHLVMEWADYTLADLMDGRILARRSRCESCAGPTDQKSCPEAQPAKCRLRNEPFFAPDEIVAVMDPIRKALANTHDHNVFHRDIKPSNVLLINESVTPPPNLPAGITAWGDRIVLVQGSEAKVLRVVLSDFGIARDQGRPATGTQRLGTPDYMSPEQILGNQLTKRTDIYSLGVLLFELLTGRLPYRGDPGFIYNAVLKGRPPLPSSFNVTVLKGLDLVTQCAMRTRDDARFEDSNEYFVALKKAAAGFIPELPPNPDAPVEPDREPAVVEADPGNGNGRKRLGVIFAGILAFAGAYLLWFFDPRRANGPVPPEAVSHVQLYGDGKLLTEPIPRLERYRVEGICTPPKGRSSAKAPVQVEVRGIGVVASVGGICESKDGELRVSAVVLPNFDSSGRFSLALVDGKRVLAEKRYLVAGTPEHGVPTEEIRPLAQVKPSCAPRSLTRFLTMPKVDPLPVTIESLQVIVEGPVDSGCAVRDQAIEMRLEDAAGNPAGGPVRMVCHSPVDPNRFEARVSISNLDLGLGDWRFRFFAAGREIGLKHFVRSVGIEENMSHPKDIVGDKAGSYYIVGYQKCIQMPGARSRKCDEYARCVAGNSLLDRPFALIRCP